MKKSEAHDKLTKFMIEEILPDETRTIEQDAYLILDFCVNELGMLPPAYLPKEFKDTSDCAKRINVPIFKWEDE